MKNKLGTILFILAVIILFGYLVIVFHFPNQYQRIAIWLIPSQNKDSFNQNRNAEILKIVLQIIGGLGAFFALFVSYQRVKLTENSVKIQSDAINKQSDQIALATKSQIDERFKNAIEHLGSDKEPIILGGVAELNQIARENKNDYSVIVFKILCSYVRSEAKKRKNPNLINYTITQSIIDYLFKNQENLYNGLFANFSHCNLSGINIDKCEISNANFSFCYLPQIKDVTFNNCEFEFSMFEACSIRKCKFISAKTGQLLFYNSNLNEVVFYGTPVPNFLNCKLTQVDFTNDSSSYKSTFIACDILLLKFNLKMLSSCSFIASNISRTSFENVESIYNCDFRATNFEKISFGKTTIENCNFSGSYSEQILIFSKDLSAQLESRRGKGSEIKDLFQSAASIENCVFDELSEIQISEIKKLHESILLKAKDQFRLAVV